MQGLPTGGWTLTLSSSASASRPSASARALMSSLTRSSFDSAAFVAACCATSARCPSTWSSIVQAWDIWYRWDENCHWALCAKAHKSHGCPPTCS
jgi:hypothetical protein